MVFHSLKPVQPLVARGLRVIKTPWAGYRPYPPGLSHWMTLGASPQVDELDRVLAHANYNVWPHVWLHCWWMRPYRAAWNAVFWGEAEAWLKPRSRNLPTWSGTGTTASHPRIWLGSASTSSAPRGPARARLRRYLNMWIASRSGAS